MLRHRIEHSSGRLGAGSVIKEDKSILQSGKCGANLAYGELWHDPNNIPLSSISIGGKAFGSVRIPELADFVLYFL
jgi:hypothetical protein